MPRWLALGAFALFVLAGLVILAVTTWPGAFDELQHVSLVAHLQEGGGLLPRYDAHLTLDPRDLSAWTERRNYVGHPPPFYLLLAPFLERSLPPAEAVLPLRFVSFGLLAAGVALALQAGARYFGHDERALLVFCSIAALSPRLLVTASQVNNDSLALLGGALAYWGATRAKWSAPIVGAGLALALWAKPNAGLLIGAWVGALLLLRPSGSLLLALGVGGTLGALPLAAIWWEYGSPVPVAGETLLQFPPHLLADGLGTYAWAFPRTLAATWHATPLSPFAVTSGCAAYACAAAGGWLAWQRRGDRRAHAAVAGIAAFLAVMPIHFWFAAAPLGYSIAAASIRYYLPLWPMLAHSAAFGAMAARHPAARLVLAYGALAAVGVGWLL